MKLAVLRRFTAGFLFLLVFGFSDTLMGQSTFGTVVGTVKDPTGAVVINAVVELFNVGTNATHTSRSDQDGTYQFENVDVGEYQVRVQAPGFKNAVAERFWLAARESKRLDITLVVASQITQVEVTVNSAAAVQTEVSNVGETKGSRELIDLPVAITTRANGSTSAFSTLTAQPGVQTDDYGNISVAGSNYSQVSTSIDGISSVAPGYPYGAMSEMFPSFNSIEEIRISETLNPAEYGGVADVTTVSKSGTNSYHGGLFENYQTTGLDAKDYFSQEATPIHLNDFGVFLGGPVVIPHIYDGHNRTFFFFSGEALRLPKHFTAITSVPTQDMRDGNLSVYSDPINAILYPGNIIPQNQISSFATAFLNAWYPLPNYGPAGAVTNNYLASYSVPINSAQFDARIDQKITDKHSVFFRYSFKNRSITTFPTDINGNPSSPLLGNVSAPEIYNALAGDWNWFISPSIVNEVRGGFSKRRTNVSFGVTAQQAANLLGLTNLPGGIPAGDDIPELNLSGFMSFMSPVVNTNPHQETLQLLDTLTWSRGKHTLKFGADYRHLESLFTAVYNDWRMGDYTFNGSSLGTCTPQPPQTTCTPFLNGEGGPFAGFLLGYPDNTQIATVLNPTTDAYSNHYAFFAQDDWKLTPALTLNIGLRYEYHPAFGDYRNNLANFDPNYTSTVNGQTVNGAVVVPSQATFPSVNPSFVESIAPIPVITAAQAGIPSALRFSQKTDFAPRIGFAWRIFYDNKTVLRGGYGRFIETLLSSTAFNGWAVESSDVGLFANSLGSNGLPVFSLPYSWPSNIAQPGTDAFYFATYLHYRDPYVNEWNLTLERELGREVIFRASYDGNHSGSLGVWLNAKQLQPNTQGFDVLSGTAPFPEFVYIANQSPLGYGNYSAGTFSLNKKMSHGLEFETSYVYTRNLSNVNGAAGYGFQAETGSWLSNPYDPGLDYGNAYTRRHRFLTTFLYEIPFGKGKPLLNTTNGLVDRIVGGWVVSGVLVFQSGPFMTVTTLNDPSGTGYNVFNSTGGRADVVPGVSPYQGQSIAQWINPNAFADPPNNIGRFGDSSEGSVVGPGTKAVAMSLLKRVAITEKARMEIGAQVANLFNHPNFGPPSNLTLGVPGFGQITSLQNAEGAGPRAVQLTARINF